ncbi:hypothetical protein HDU98_004470 [Podochytrium sp. JEL0797]|nr:hypothetical protein HDU98_004470 [Podochytrium sp. JEL0797]
MRAVLVFAQLYRISAPALLLLILPLLAILDLLLSLWHKPPMFHAKGKVVFITGASSGIGAAVAERYAQLGAVLILCARRRSELEAVGAKCRALGAQEVICEILDVTVEDQMQSAIQRTGDRFGLIDLLLLNAGNGMGKEVRNCPNTTEFRDLMELNYLSVVSGVLYALPYLKASTRGRVAVVSSILGFQSAPCTSGYAASKFALKGFLDSLRMEEPTLSITLIYPGMVHTDIFTKFEGSNKVTPRNTLTQVMAVDEAAELIVDAVKIGRWNEVFTLEGNFAWFAKDIAPRVVALLTIFGFEYSRKRKSN